MAEQSKKGQSNEAQSNEGALARQGRQIRYRAIADELRTRIAGGDLGPGAVLPSEAELAAANGVSRVTVRKALELLRDDGLVDARQGFGWFVAGDTVRQQLGALGTIEGQLADAGRASRRRVVSFRFVPPPARVAHALGGDGSAGDEVLEVVRVNLADGAPFAVVTVWCPSDLGGSLSRDDVERDTFYDLLPVRFGSAVQTIGAAAADAVDASRLDVPEGSPLLVCERVSHDDDGVPVLVSEHRFPAHRTEFVVELASPGTGLSPSGLRLVDDEPA